MDPTRLTEAFSEGGGLRITDAGLWHATPIDVVASAVALLRSRGVFDGIRTVVDLGAGDGRWLAALALALPGVTVAGLEDDAALARSATRTLDALGSSARVGRGDYRSATAWDALGVRSGSIDVAFNYPDGNEGALLDWLDTHGAPDARLVVVSGELEVRLSREPEWRAGLVRTSGLPWQVAVFRRAA